ncbi:MAG: helix-turn-helix domain-containing protein [Nocardioidaceae bacterium]
MGLVTSAALGTCALYFWRFGDSHGLVPFLLGCGLLVVAVVHGIAWQESRLPLLTIDMTGLMVRLGGRFVALPWNDVELVEVTRRGRLGDGRVTVQPRDVRRVMAAAGLRSRLAAFLNRWLYDAPLVVPVGLTATSSVDDIPGTVSRLADGRVPVVVAGETTAEPAPTVELSGAAVLRHRVQPEPDSPAAPAAPARRPEPSLPAPRRLAAVVSALRSQSGRRGQTSAPAAPETATAGALALADPPGEAREPLPEVRELRRLAPEEVDAGPGDVALRSANVELVIDATADLSAGAMRSIRRRPAPAASRPVPPEPAEVPVAVVTAPPLTEPHPAALAIGERIHQARTRLGVSVDDLADRTRIRPYVIESIEIGNFSPCGGDFYARGHLRMLAGVLGIDPAPLLTSYDEHLAGDPVSPRAVFDAELSTGVVRPTGSGSRWGALVAAVLVLLLVWGVARILSENGPDTSSRLDAPRSARAAAGPALVGSPDIRDLQVALPEPVRVSLHATGGSSRVVVWDSSRTVVFQGTLGNGASKVVSARPPLRVMAVDGGVVELTAPGSPPARMGAAGERVFAFVR